MGIDVSVARFLLSAKCRGVNFKRTAMLGRQGMLLEPHTLHALISEFSLLPAGEMPTELTECCREGGYAEELLRFLGAESITSIDANAYEGATVVHDMNAPIPACLKSSFDIVIDGGTLEHIFNFPVAIKNCMDMVDVNGHFLSVTPANNFSGHGFYQFSPELFFRVLCPDNGFIVERAFITEVDGDRPWFMIPDPATIGKRVAFVSGFPTYLLTLARKLAECEVLQATPQQSDYVGVWQGQSPTWRSEKTPSPASTAKPLSLRHLMRSLLPQRATGLIRAFRNHRARRRHLVALSPGPRGVFLKNSDPI